eukprot:COSAG01_NODE_2921_length_6846_cov_4.205276_7_plen_99_part_00
MTICVNELQKMVPEYQALRAKVDQLETTVSSTHSNGQSITGTVSADVIDYEITTLKQLAREAEAREQAIRDQLGSVEAYAEDEQARVSDELAESRRLS